MKLLLPLLILSLISSIISLITWSDSNDSQCPKLLDYISNFCTCKCTFLQAKWKKNLSNVFPFLK